MIRTEFNSQIHILWMDDGGEHINHNMENCFLSTNGLIHQTSCSDTPQQNGVIEQKNCTLLALTVALMIESHVPHYF